VKNYQNIAACSSENPEWNQIVMQHANTRPTVLPQKLIRHYLAARYQARIKPNHSITLRAGDYSAPLATLLQTSGCRNAIYITACNPASQMVTPAKNQSATIQLYQHLTRYSKFIYPGESTDPAEQWPAEAGINLATATTVGHTFGQNAILWIGADAIPRLVLLR